ncbi:MAG: glycosyltransferase [Planctomycetaceae bacterium]
MNSTPPLSIVIPAFNEEALLGQTIDALQEALSEVGIVGAEVIVSNDGSTDRTAEVAESKGASVVTTENRQIAATRNAGAAVASSERLLFLDADTILPADTLRAAIKAMDEGAIGCGVTVEFDKVPNIFIRMMSSVILTIVRWTGCAAGCCIFTTAKGFAAAGGFPEEYYASEELWFCRALRREGRFVQLKHTVKTSARKMDYHSTLKIFWMMVKLTVKGPRALRDRKDLELWYDGQRG